MLRIVTIVAATLALVGTLPASGQIPSRFSPTGAVLSRAELEGLLEQYEAALASPVYSAELKEAAREGAQRVRSRLEEGDFRVGDRIAISVQGEENLPDTVPVQPGPKITLPLFGEIGLEGVLRSEITDHLTQEIGRFIRNPVVQAEGLMRLSIQGSVGSPGFYVVPADMLLSEAIMMAGGPGQTSDLEGLRVERSGQLLLDGEATQEALVEGRTLDQLSLQAGDQLVVPMDQPRSQLWGRLGRWALIVGSFLIFGVRVVF
jgi:protein involved in polysaccharide export with SLBB domain